jgi:hypothetical protein
MLKPSEREKLEHCQLMIQSVRYILQGMRAELFPTRHEIDKCFRQADEAIGRLLRA